MMSALPLQIKSGGKVYYIRYALPDDALAIKSVVTQAFESYQDEINKSAAAHPTVHALTETVEEILADIKNECVLVAVNGKKQVIGTIRMKSKSEDLAYVYRFGVLPQIKNIGIGSKLLGCICDICEEKNFKAVALHTNARFYTLARYYYGKRFFVHSTTTDKGYIRALFIKELTDDRSYDISPAFEE